MPGSSFRGGGTAAAPTVPFPLPSLDPVGGPHSKPDPDDALLLEEWTESPRRKKARMDGNRIKRDDSDEPVFVPTPPPRKRKRMEIPALDPLVQPLPMDAPCRLIQYQGKGLGLQTTRPIARGEVIIRERPFIRFQHPISHLELLDEWKRLNPREQALFHTFTGTCKDEPDPWVNIAETNCIDMLNPEDLENSEGEHWAGLFEFVCRVNHSCSPNSGWSWDERRRELEPMLQGEEITASYKGDAVFQPLLERRTLLDTAFGFTCLCLRCSKPSTDSHLSDNRFARYRAIRNQWRADIRDFAFDRGKALKLLSEAEGLLIAEGMEGRKGELLEQRYYIHALWGEQRTAVQAGKRALQWLETVEGKARAMRQEFAAIAESPEAFWGWGLALEDNGGVLSDDEDVLSDYEGRRGRRSQVRRSRAGL